MHQSLRARRELCSERGCFHPRRPENGLGLQRIGRAAAVDRNPALLDVGHLHARPDGDSEIGKGLRRSGREPRGIGQEQPVGGLEEENARASGIDGAEIESESLSRELADGPRELDPGRTSSHDDEREKRLPFRQIFLALRPLERVENPGAYSRRILDRLEPRGPPTPPSRPPPPPTNAGPGAPPVAITNTPTAPPSGAKIQPHIPAKALVAMGP